MVLWSEQFEAMGTTAIYEGFDIAKFGLPAFFFGNLLLNVLHCTPLRTLMFLCCNRESNSHISVITERLKIDNRATNIVITLISRGGRKKLLAIDGLQVGRC